MNGARSTAMNDHIMYSYSRDQQADHPVLLFYALVGNDVRRHDMDSWLQERERERGLAVRG